jgi:hypothetical protein
LCACLGQATGKLTRASNWRLKKENIQFGRQDFSGCYCIERVYLGNLSRAHFSDFLQGQALIHSGFSLEYKYIIVRNAEVIWETGPVNRSLKTSFEMMIVDDGWFNGVRVDVQTASNSGKDGTSVGTESEVEDKSQKTLTGSSSWGNKLLQQTSSATGNGVVIVAAVLPVKLTLTDEGKYEIAWDTQRAVSKLRNPKRNFKYVGWVGMAVPEKDQALLLYMCPPHAALCVSSSFCYICVLIPLYMCPPDTAIYRHRSASAS